MGQRIAALWKKQKEGDVSITGTIETATGINIPANSHDTGVSLVKNKDKVEGDNKPDYYIELWEKTQQGAN